MPPTEIPYEKVIYTSPNLFTLKFSILGPKIVGQVTLLLGAQFAVTRICINGIVIYNRIWGPDAIVDYLVEKVPPLLEGS